MKKPLKQGVVVEIVRGKLLDRQRRRIGGCSMVLARHRTSACSIGGTRGAAAACHLTAVVAVAVQKGGGVRLGLWLAAGRLYCSAGRFIQTRHRGQTFLPI